MATLKDYKQFEGRHWETGTVHNYLAYRGFKAPHTGQPYSEALLMGVSGGAVMGYFTFVYEGYDPQCRILTRNTFDPLETMLSRLGIVQHRQHTSKPEKGVSNLVDTLESGVPAIVWADMFGLGYNAVDFEEENWAMMPVLVHSYDEAAGQASIADRAAVSLSVGLDELHKARARVKKDKFRVLTLDPPNPEKLTAAVQAGIWDCINLYTEKPPKGSKNNFGLQAYRFWADMLRNPKGRLSWEKIFPAGRNMFIGLKDAYYYALLFGKAGGAERDTYADFLDEAALVLDRPALNEAAECFRDAERAWQGLGKALLPDDIAPFKETRELMHEEQDLFIRQGNASVEARRAVKDRLTALADQMESDFPLDAAGVTRFREGLADKVMEVLAVEETAVEALRAAITA